MNIALHADDMGLCPASDLIFKKILTKGRCRSVSLLPNMPGFDGVVAFLKRRPDIRVSAHVNLVEGMAVSPPTAIPAIVNPEGRFRRNFITLWAVCRLFPQAVIPQVEREMGAQIGKIRDALGWDRPLSLDGHMHIHMLPPIFRLLPRLSERYNISSIRVAYEPMTLRSALTNVHAGVLKNVLLNVLSRQPAKIPRRSDCVIGILHSGKMNQSTIEADLKKIPSTLDSVEVILHPASVNQQDHHVSHNHFERFYSHPHRQIEAGILLKGIASDDPH
jgi:predicted glycoside hydrolase/deacetylase ChbG (UPF0249 family)